MPAGCDFKTRVQLKLLQNIVDMNPYGKGYETLAAVLAPSIPILPRTHFSPCPHSTADNIQYVFLNAFDSIAAVFYS
jgi:hypothetical protein